MKFRTEYFAQKAPFSLDPSRPVVLAGSCFAQNMTAKMLEHDWTAVNPLGTLYNPSSICIALNIMSDGEKGRQRFEDSLFHSNGIWHSHLFDSSFSSANRDDCVEEFMLRQKLLMHNLRQGKILIVTFGTSICYYLKGEDKPVGNCHKQPSELYYTSRLSVEDIKEQWRKAIEELRRKIEGLKVIFTVSPVRHLKNGFEGNARSKAILLLAVEEICRSVADCFYFPAYEIVNDDLRDYRFYAGDLAHPSAEAVEYIWEKFKETYIDGSGEQLLASGCRRIKASAHRPMTGALGKTLEKGNRP